VVMTLIPRAANVTSAGWNKVQANGILDKVTTMRFKGGVQTRNSVEIRVRSAINDSEGSGLSGVRATIDTAAPLG